MISSLTCHFVALKFTGLLKWTVLYDVVIVCLELVIISSTGKKTGMCLQLTSFLLNWAAREISY